MKIYVESQVNFKLRLTLILYMPVKLSKRKKILYMS
jgi:hypothetical protein